VPAAPGLAAGRARVYRPLADSQPAPVEAAQRPRESERAERALAASAAELTSLAERLRGDGRAAEAEIVETGALMAEDPLLADTIRVAILEAGQSAPHAILQATERYAAQLAALEDETLAERAADVRSLGQRAARLCGGSDAQVLGTAASGPDDIVLVARELGPADVAELGGEVQAVALAAGGVTAHAAIVARSLGLPMVVGLGEAVLELGEGQPLVVDGTAGLVVDAPDPDRLSAAHAAVAERKQAAAAASAARALPAVTRDGHRVRVLANVASSAEVTLALASGAEGVGLVRTELAFLEAADAWPRFEQHERALRPVLEPLAGRTATVRLLDFGGDKTPPFLRGRHGRGVQLLREAPEALAAQLRAVLAAGKDTDLRLLVPMVTGPDDVRWVKEVLRDVAAQLPDLRRPSVGAMVEVPAAATLADRLAAEVDFFSIGTNDLTQFVLGLDRTTPGRAPAHHPAVLRLIDATVRAAHAAGLVVDVCGEAASDPVGLPLLLGLGVDELSVGAARVGTVRAWTRALEHAAAQDVASLALNAASAADVESLVRPLSQPLHEASAR
jgi:phosphoenolpyruvate-protein phosphotransferase